MTAKNILMIENTYNGVGGHDTVIVNLCLELQKLGYNPILGAFNFIVDPPEQIPTVKLKKSSFMKNSIDGLNFDIIHSHEPLMNYYCLFNKIPLIYHFHGPNGSLQALNFRLSMKICKKRISKIITVSKSSMSYLKNKIENLPVEIIYNGVETNFFLPDLPKPHVKGKPQILFVGNLLESKNVITLVYSMKYILKRYPDANLQIVGDGPEYTNLETAIKKENLEKNIFLIGQENREQIKFRFSSCDIFISSSVAEQHSITAFEAMSCGKPVLLSDIPPFREVISDSGTGLIFSPYDTSEIADKVEEIFENYDKFTSNTRNWAEKFSWKDSAKQVANIYETMI
jgi:glycosyltransferase involved in cell wall biosynthesis|tara:strand:+ start:9162 stop:10187 length:1026 start_codon:yes stop_codon:yes gene_type:complete